MSFVIEKNQPMLQSKLRIGYKWRTTKKEWYSRIRKQREGNTVGKRLERTSVEKRMNLSKWVTDDGKE